MAKQDVLQEVKNRMKEMQDNKATELNAIYQKKAEAQTQKEAADLALKEATESMDLDAYEEAKQAKRKAQTAIDMYSGRYNQIKQQEYISEAESDKVIDSLLVYEEQAAETFKKDLAEQLKQINKIYADYKNTVRETEETIDAWQRDIHANYNSRGASSWVDPETGETTGRSSTPIPVHRLPYTGCTEAAQLGEYLGKVAYLLQA